MQPKKRQGKKQRVRAPLSNAALATAKLGTLAGGDSLDEAPQADNDEDEGEDGDEEEDEDEDEDGDDDGVESGEGDGGDGAESGEGDGGDGDESDGSVEPFELEGRPALSSGSGSVFHPDQEGDN